MTEWTLPTKGLFVTGTDTDVGKTWVSARILQVLSTFSRQKPAFFAAQKKAFRKNGGDPLYCARKPVASGAVFDDGKLLSEDTRILAQQTGERLEKITRYTFAAPVAPNLAAQACGMDTSLGNLLEACNSPADSWTLVEGAGGFYSPLGSDNSLNADLAAALKLPVLLVTGLRLGCINHTLLTLEAIEQRGLNCAGIVLNDLHNRHDAKTAEALTKLTPLPLYSMPHGQPDHHWPEWVKTHLNL